MQKDYISNLDELAFEFMQELKSGRSLSVYLVPPAPAGAEAERLYLGYDIRPEDLEALYFEGLGVPRWESVAAGTVTQHLKNYRAAFDERVAAYPFVGRVRDTDRTAVFTAEETSGLREECERILGSHPSPAAARTAQKFYLACEKAALAGAGLELLPS